MADRRAAGGIREHRRANHAAKRPGGADFLQPLHLPNPPSIHRRAFFMASSFEKIVNIILEVGVRWELKGFMGILVQMLGSHSHQKSRI